MHIYTSSRHNLFFDCISFARKEREYGRCGQANQHQEERRGRSGRAIVRFVEAGGWTAHHKSKEASRDSALDVLWAKRTTAGDLISLASLLSD